jgi:scyllo-inositol 2-dehydrogenase (NADP+)
MQTQLRFCIKGDKGSFTKYGLDPQESAMKAFDPKGIKVGDEGWGKEDEKMYGTLEVVGDDFVTFSKST